MIRVTAWRSLPSSAESSLRLLPAPLPLLRHVSLDARLAPGGGNAIKGGGRLGPRGGFTALSPASRHPQPTKSPPRLSQQPPVKLPQQQIPRRRQQLHPRRGSRLRNRRLCHLHRSLSRHSKHHNHRRHHRSRHPTPRKRAKTVSEATRSSSRATVVAKKRQIPQLDGCLSPPISPPQPASRPPVPSALANLPPSQVQQPTSSLLVPDTTAPAPLPSSQPPS
jgi:hypothetical protein